VHVNGALFETAPAICTSFKPNPVSIRFNPHPVVGYVNWFTIQTRVFTRIRFSLIRILNRLNTPCKRNTITVFLIQEVRCRPQYHPRQLLQQIEKWKKPSVLRLVSKVGHIGRLFGPKLASHHGVTGPVAASQIS